MVVFLLMVGILPVVHAEDINLQCDDLAYGLARQLSNEGLIGHDADTFEKTKQIAIAQCLKAQSSAQVQLKANKEDWLKNWLLEDTGGKPGNKRLKNLKR